MKRLILCAVALAVLLPSVAQAGKGLPATRVVVNTNSTITVSTTASTKGLDTTVYITGRTAGLNFTYHQSIPATIAVDPGWNCPCTAQITKRGKNGTSTVITAPSAPFTP